MACIIMDFTLAAMNATLYMETGRFISAFASGFCCAMGVAIILDKILNKF